MSKLVGTILETTISQDFNLILEERQTIGGIRPHVLLAGSPSGTFTFSIKDGATTLASKDFTFAECQTDLSTIKTRMHLYKGLLLDSEIELKRGSYRLELSASGYTPSSTSYLAWLSDWDNFYFETNGTASSDLDQPYSFELWSYKRRTFS